MSLAIGKKGQNVRLAAKLVKWKVDIKGAAEALGMGEHPSAFMPSVAISDIDFLDEIKNAKGLGGKVMTILFNDNLVTYDEALSRGVKGMVKLTGIGPKKAEALVELAENIKERIAAEILEIAAREAEAKAVKEASKTAEEERKVIDNPENDDKEILIQDLPGVARELLDLLEINGFETVAELSVTSLDELIAIDGVDEDSGKDIIEKVKRELENAGNV
jgi:N utilization substance protein A